MTRQCKYLHREIPKRSTWSAGHHHHRAGGAVLVALCCLVSALIEPTSAYEVENNFAALYRGAISQELESQLAAAKRLVGLQVSSAATELLVNGSNVYEDVQRKLLYSAIQSVKTTSKENKKEHSFVFGLSTAWEEQLQSDYNCSFFQYQNYNKSYSSGYTYTFATTKYGGCTDGATYNVSRDDPKYLGDTSSWDPNALCMKYYDVNAAGRPTDLLAFNNYNPCGRDWFLTGRNKTSWYGPFQYSEGGLLGLAFSMPMTTPRYRGGEKTVGVSTAFTLIHDFEVYLQDNFGSSGQLAYDKFVYIVDDVTGKLVAASEKGLAVEKLDSGGVLNIAANESSNEDIVYIETYFQRGKMVGSQNGTVYLMSLPLMNTSWVSSETMAFDDSLTSWTGSWRMVIVETVTCVDGFQPDVSSEGERIWPSPSRTLKGGTCIACPAGKALTVASGEVACQKCGAGTYSYSAFGECENCPADYFSGVNASSCSKCATVGATSSEGASSCDQCLEGYYLDPNTLQCEGCPIGAKCPGGLAQPFPKKGYWASPDHAVTTSYLFECGDDKCEGNFTCFEKWTGNLCALENEGYFSISGVAWTCPSTIAGRWTQGVLLFLLLMGIWIWFNTVLIVEYDSFDMFMQTVQNCALIYEFGLDYHKSLSDWLEPVLGIALFDLGLIHFKCLDRNWDFVWAFWLQMSVAFVWAFFEIAYWLISTGLHPKHMRSAKERAELAEARRLMKERQGLSEIREDSLNSLASPSKHAPSPGDDDWDTDPAEDGYGFFSTKRWFEGAKDKESRFCEGRDKALGRTLLVIDSSHATICLYCVKVLPFFCTELADGKEYLDAAPHVECGTIGHDLMVAMAVAMLCLVGIGYPIGCASYVLHYFRDYGLKGNETKKNYFNERLDNRLGFQLDAFRGPMIAWNGFIISKQMALIVIGAAFRLFNKSYHFVQGVLCFILLLLNVVMSSFGRPYVRADLNDLDIFYVINESVFLCFGFLFSSLNAESSAYDTVYYLVLLQFIGMAAASGIFILIDYTTNQINKRMKRTFATDWEKQGETADQLIAAANAVPDALTGSVEVMRGSLHNFSVDALPDSVKKAAKRMSETDVVDTLRKLPRDTQEKLKALPHDAQAAFIAASRSTIASTEQAAVAALEAGKQVADLTSTTLVTMNKAITELVTGEHENEGPMTDEELVYVYALVSAINGPHLRRWFADHYGNPTALFCNKTKLDRSVFLDFENLAIMSKINDAAFSEKSIFSPYHKLSRNATSPEAIFWHDLIDCFPGIIDWVLYELDTERKRRQVLSIFRSLQIYVEKFHENENRLALRINKHHRAPLLFKLLESSDTPPPQMSGSPANKETRSYIQLMKLFLIRLGNEEEEVSAGRDKLKRGLSERHKIKWVHKKDEWKSEEQRRRAAEDEKRRQIEEKRRRESLTRTFSELQQEEETKGWGGGESPMADDSPAESRRRDDMRSRSAPPASSPDIPDGPVPQPPPPPDADGEGEGKTSFFGLQF